MRRTTIKWRLFKYNLIVISMMIVLVAIIFNITARIYIEREIGGQLTRIASRAEATTLEHGSGIFVDRKNITQDIQSRSSYFRFYLFLSRSLRENLSVLNAEYVFFDKNINVFSPFQDEISSPPSALIESLKKEISKNTNITSEEKFNLYLSGDEYLAVVKPVFQKNSFGLGWIVIYSSLEKINQLQLGINMVLLAILLISAVIILIFSSFASKKISAPFSSLNDHISTLAGRNFGTRINIPVDDELQQLVSNINLMTEKLESHDKAQKTFLQNASHEFRTPIMSIQSYAEGIKYGVVEKNTAAGIIIDESKRLTRLVEDLLYLSRLDTIEEHYHFDSLYFEDLINSCIERVNGIAIKSGITIGKSVHDPKIIIPGDEEKLSRAITNIMENCIRYASGRVNIQSESNGDMLEVCVSDDGPGFDNEELPNIFERFYKGKKGNFGLGLAISRSVIEKHNGRITAENTQNGALFRIYLPILQGQ